MNRSRNSQKLKQQKQKPICISYDEFTILLSILQDQQQAKELEQLVRNHALIEHRPKERYFTGKGSIMSQIQYLIQKFTHDITYLDSQLDIQPSHQQSILYKRVFYGQPISITPLNYKSIVSDIVLLSAIPSNRFEILYTPRQKQTIKQEGLFSNILITNKSIKDKKIFMIFEHISEILQLQSLIDEELPLSKFKPIFNHFQAQSSNMSRSTIQNNKEIYFFMRRNEKDWDKFIHNININSGTNDVILMKFKLFGELRQRKTLFNRNIRVVMDQEEVKIDIEEISQLKVFENTVESIHSLEELAIKIIETGSKHYKYKDSYLDPVTCFNICLLQERKVDSLYFVEGGSQKQYIVFPFYKKMMEIEVDAQTKTVRLTPRDLVTEIGNKHYLQAIQKIRKHAVINQLPFYILYKEANEVAKVKISNLQSSQTGDIIKLLTYRYLLNKIKYKIVAEDGQHQQDIMNRYEKIFHITFEKESPIFSKIGKIKSQSIIKKVKVKEGEKDMGRMIAQAHFARLFTEKCLAELTSK